MIRDPSINVFTHDVDRLAALYSRLERAPSLRPPYDFQAANSVLHSAWLADPNGNPITLAQQLKKGPAYAQVDGKSPEGWMLV